MEKIKTYILESNILTGNIVDKYIQKADDQSVTSNITLINDEDLFFTVENGLRYLASVTLFVKNNSLSVNGIRFAMLAPGAELSEVMIYDLAAGEEAMIPCNFLITAAADGTAQLQWAQKTSDAAAITLLRHSILEKTELS